MKKKSHLMIRYEANMAKLVRCWNCQRLQLPRVTCRSCGYQLPVLRTS